MERFVGLDEPAGESNPVRQVCGIGHGWANASWGRAERGVGESRGKARDGKRGWAAVSLERVVGVSRESMSRPGSRTPCEPLEHAREPHGRVRGEMRGRARRPERGAREVDRRVGLPRCGDKSSEPRLNLSGSWQQGHSAAYNTPFLIQVVCK